MTYLNRRERKVAQSYFGLDTPLAGQRRNLKARREAAKKLFAPVCRRDAGYKLGLRGAFSVLFVRTKGTTAALQKFQALKEKQKERINDCH